MRAIGYNQSDSADKHGSGDINRNGGLPELILSAHSRSRDSFAGMRIGRMHKVGSKERKEKPVP